MAIQFSRGHVVWRGVALLPADLTITRTPAQGALEGGTNIASNTKDMEVELVNDAAVIALAERAHREAFPNFPVLAFDIIRDAETGSLYVLECHAGGTWMFSADAGLGIEAANNLDFRRQFDAIDKAAAILARETPLRAAVCWPIATRSWPGGLHN
jgi:hypothetical protein